MSKIVKKTGYRELSHVVQTDDGCYFMVDSALTSDCGYETMVFSWDNKTNKVDCWAELYCEHYRNEDDMSRRHEAICDHLENYLESEDE